MIDMENNAQTPENPKYDAKLPVSGSFYSLIDRLQKHSELKYPECKWNNDFYYECAFQWKGKEKELEERVFKLENDMRLSNSRSLDKCYKSGDLCKYDCKGLCKESC
jgi:hypothetical protein